MATRACGNQKTRQCWSNRHRAANDKSHGHGRSCLKKGDSMCNKSSATNVATRKRQKHLNGDNENSLTELNELSKTTSQQGFHWYNHEDCHQKQSSITITPLLKNRRAAGCQSQSSKSYVGKINKISAPIPFHGIENFCKPGKISWSTGSGRVHPAMSDKVKFSELSKNRHWVKVTVSFP